MFPRPALWRALRRSPAFLHFVYRRFLEDRCPQTAAALAYTTLLSLVPLITVALAVLAAFPVFGDLMTELKIFLLTHMVPEIAGKIITVYMVQFSEKAARLTLVGIAFLVLTALMLMQTIEEAFNAIWRVRQARPLAQRVLTYWAVLTVGPLLLGASLSITSYLMTLSLGYARHIPLVGVHLLRPVPLLLMSLAFALLYLLVPNRRVSFRHALVGGLAAGLAFELMKKGFAWYVTGFPTFRLVYGAFAALPIFLLWIYLSWLVVLGGAVLTAALPAWAAGAGARTHRPGANFVAALEVL
ncbi:MAG: YihY family inner membrane protein, partial [Burkholderiales bacterium]